MALWLVRAGKYGERENLALEEGLVVIGWEELADLSDISSREELRAQFDQTYPDIGKSQRDNWVAQVWAFKGRIEKGDLVALPSKTQPTVAVGRVEGDYEYRAISTGESVHCRAVKWNAPDIPRSQIGQDLLYSLGAFMTVCQIKRNDAEGRFEEILKTGRDPGYGATSPDAGATADEEVQGDSYPSDLESIALDQIRKHIEWSFKGHKLANLVKALLEAQGFQTYMSPPGPDHGVDIVASKGPLGFEPPKLVVQVKSQSTPLERSVITELQGAMRNFRAECGLVVAWGGYKRTVEQERARLYFEMRLWNADDLIRAVQTHYEKLPDSIQAEIPLKRVWVLVADE